MKKILILILLTVSTNVFSEWTEVSSDGANMTGYVDLGTIKKKGNKVKMWSLSDYKTVLIYEKDNTRYLSMLVRYEYDCEEETKRILDWYLYSGNMKKGDIVFSSKNIKYEAESIVPDSIGETNFKIACVKK